MTDPTHQEDSQIDKALGEDWPVKGDATPEELAFIRELQHFYCDHIVDGVPTGDWHINHTPEQAARLLRVHVACAIREQQENHALQLGDLYHENSALRTAIDQSSAEILKLGNKLEHAENLRFSADAARRQLRVELERANETIKRLEADLLLWKGRYA